VLTTIPPHAPLLPPQKRRSRDAASHEQQTKKKTLAQLRAEKEQRGRNFDEGSRLVYDVDDALRQYILVGKIDGFRYSQWNALLGQANRAFELVQHHADTYEYRLALHVKGNIH